MLFKKTGVFHVRNHTAKNVVTSLQQWQGKARKNGKEMTDLEHRRTKSRDLNSNFPIWNLFTHLNINGDETKL